MKKLKNLFRLRLVTELTREERKGNRRWQSFFVLVTILSTFFSVHQAQARATSVTLEFETQALNLKTGTIVKILQRFTNKTAMADISIAYNADMTPHAVLMLRQANMEMAILKAVAFGQVKYTSIAKLNFTSKSIDQPLKQNNTVVVRTADGSVYTIGDVVESKNYVTFKYQQLQKGRE